MPADHFTIHTTTIAPGQRAAVKIPVGRLPSGNLIYVHAEVYRSSVPGPCLLAVGGIHGDEANGIEIVRRAMAQGLFEPLACGSVIAIPILNVYGFINFSRAVPDGKDVNRSFPGNLNGSLASRIARTLTKKILPWADFAVDFHTGSGATYNYPQIRFTPGDAAAAELVRAFGAPVSLHKPAIPKSFRRAAARQGKPVIVFEGGESLRYDEHAIRYGLEGLQRLLHAKGMRTQAPPPLPEPLLHFDKTAWVRAPKAGMFLWEKCSGQAVQKGELLGEIHSPYGEWQQPVHAPHEGYIIGHNNAPVVSQGDALFHVGWGG
jgi:uncharacterized protein